MRILSVVIPLVLIMVLAAPFILGIVSQAADSKDDPHQLLVIWTSGDRDVALKMTFMYTYYTKKMWDRTQLLVWGSSAKLLAEDTELQEYIGRMKEVGVELTACIACADMYGVTDKLKELGIDVKGMGRPLTEMLQSGEWTTLTF